MVDTKKTKLIIRDWWAYELTGTEAACAAPTWMGTSWGPRDARSTLIANPGAISNWKLLANENLVALKGVSLNGIFGDSLSHNVVSELSFNKLYLIVLHTHTHTHLPSRSSLYTRWCLVYYFYRISECVKEGSLFLVLFLGLFFPSIWFVLCQCINFVLSFLFILFLFIIVMMMMMIPQACLFTNERQKGRDLDRR